MTTKFVQQLIVENGLLTGCTAAQVDSDAMTPSGVTAGVYGDSTHTLTATVDAAGRVTALSTNAIAAGGSGTVTSVGLSVPSEFAVTGSPVTGSGTIAVTKTNQSANLVYAGPSSGSAASPSFRALTAGDLPNVPVAQGGTGRVNLTAGNLLIGNGTNAVTFLPPSINGNVVTATSAGFALNPPPTFTNGTVTLTQQSAGYNVTGTWLTIGNLTYTASAAGTYLFTGNVRIYLASGATTNVILRLQNLTQGTTITQILAAGINGTVSYNQETCPLVGIASVSANDQIAIQAYTTGAAGTAQIFSDATGQSSLCWVKLL